MRTIKYKIVYDTTVRNFLSSAQRYSARLVTALKKQDNGILLNGLKATAPDKLHAGDELIINIPDDDTDKIEAVDMPLDVIYEDEDVLAVNKGAFTVCHPTRNHQRDTLANAVAHHLEGEGIKSTFRVINRLDRDTTGIVVVALNRLSAQRLSGNIEKKYCALACGNIYEDGTIDLPIERMNERSIMRQVGENGQRAVTHYKVLKNFDGMTLLEISLDTGRTHQIRVHFAALGHPLVGDTMYGDGDSRFPHQCLHCSSVSFLQPVSRDEINLCTPPPFLNELGEISF